MRILICPTAFKETFTAREAAGAILAGVLRARPDAWTILLPLSDGGPGLLEALEAAGRVEAAGGWRGAPDPGANEARTVTLRVRDPLDRPVRGRVRIAGAEATVESADACGMHLVPEARRRPLEAHTRGVGELLLAAAAGTEGLPDRRVQVGLGGSVTVDGGTGMARALGWSFRDADGEDLPTGGGALVELDRIVPPAERPLDGVRVLALADVRSPLLGERGAARQFGPQKGATPEQVERLEAGLARLAERCRADLGKDIAHLQGAGSAGGLGAGCVAFAGAELAIGAPWVLERAGFDRRLAEADLAITGEGAFDSTSHLGKLPAEVIRRARKAEVPVLLVCGTLHGEVPAGVRVAGGDGTWLDAPAISDRVAEALA